VTGDTVRGDPKTGEGWDSLEISSTAMVGS
jgi:hypothetical protein